MIQTNLKRENSMPAMNIDNSRFFTKISMGKNLITHVDNSSQDGHDDTFGTIQLSQIDEHQNYLEQVKLKKSINLILSDSKRMNLQNKITQKLDEIQGNQKSIDKLINSHEGKTRRESSAKCI